MKGIKSPLYGKQNCRLVFHRRFSIIFYQNYDQHFRIMRIKLEMNRVRASNRNALFSIGIIQGYEIRRPNEFTSIFW